MRYAWAVETHVGLTRSRNEDAVAPATDGAADGPVVIAVADGMGGHAAGEVASRIAIETVAVSEAGPAERVVAANQAIVEAAEKRSDQFGMGTTLTLGIFGADGTLQIAHVGDSRAYLLRDGKLEQVTSDHTLVARLVAEGHITEEQARHHPRRHLVMQSIGMRDIEIEEREVQLQPGDRVLLCTDGLTVMIEDSEVATLLAGASAASAAWALIDAANAAGGYDNTTVAVVDVAP